MSPAGTLAAALSLLSLLSLSLPISSSSSSSLRRPSPPPMVLPLVLSFPNTSRLRSGDGDSPFRRRQLQKKDETSSARMRLYDDLLTNGYYTTRLYIGTPPQEFALIVDSGSTVTYVPCSTCEQCGNHQDPKFQPDLSSSYEPIACNIDCNCDKEKNQCSYERQYAEMSSSSGVLGTDVISFGNLSALDAQRVEFGCENMETGDIFSQHADGIMGLGRGPLSIMDQLVEKNVISDSFSLCYGGMDIGGGAMVLGSIPFPPEMVFSHSDPVRSPYYNIELKEIRVSGQSLKVNPSVFNSRHGTVLDSGTTYAYLPQAAFGALRDSIMAQLQSLKQIPGPDPSYKDICFSGGGSEVSKLSDVFPEVEMVFSNGQKLPLSPENYLFRHSKVPGAYCLGVFQNGKDPTTLLGGIVVRNTLVTYDRENQRIGFWKTNCSELWERLRLYGAPLPAPLESSNGNSTPGPSLAPSSEASPVGFQDGNITGPLLAGLLTLEILLNISQTDLEPHISDFAELIAHDLDLNTTQVQVLSFKGEGNTSFIKLVIIPGDSGASSLNATEIVYRLTEHHIHLPEKFGGYELLEWNFYPVYRRTWLQQHTIIITLGVTATVVLSLGTFLGWYFWKRRQRIGMYRPVDAPVPEQELQPL